MLLAVLMTVLIISLPLLLLPPVIERLFAQAQLRAMVRRIFKIDSHATIVDIPDPVAPKS